MAKFLIVDTKPEELKKGEYLIDRPSFLEEITLHKSKAPKNGLTGAYHLRIITDSVAQNYDPDNMTAFSVKVHNFEGIAYDSDEQLNDILVKMYSDSCPGVFLKYVDKKIRTRPHGTSLIYYVDSGLKGAYDLFYKHGISDARDTDVKKNTENKKVVGKPAVTKEQAELLKQ